LDFAAAVQCTTSTLGNRQRRMLSSIRRFGKHCTYSSNSDSLLADRLYWLMFFMVFSVRQVTCWDSTLNWQPLSSTSPSTHCSLITLPFDATYLYSHNPRYMN
jgi:hypothetical protein